MDFRLWHCWSRIVKQMRSIDEQSEMFANQGFTVALLMAPGNQGNLGLQVPSLQEDKYHHRLPRAGVTARPHTSP